jgi:hypothetical protein
MFTIQKTLGLFLVDLTPSVAVFSATALPSNSGYLYGTKLSAQEKEALIQF